MKCKPYSEITVEIRTQLKTVKITSDIFAVCVMCQKKGNFPLLYVSTEIDRQASFSNRVDPS